MNKQCIKCKSILPIESFHKDKTKKLGVRNICKKCISIFRTSKEFKKYRKNYGIQNKSQILWSKAKCRSKNNVDFNIDITDIVIPNVCPILGIPINCSSNKTYDNSPSIDRINPTLGYIKNNICVISHKANMIKSFGTLEDHQKIVDFLENGNKYQGDYYSHEEFKTQIYQLLRSRKHRNNKTHKRDFTLVKEDIKVPKKCPILGIDIELHNKIPMDSSPSIDRIDNMKGYTRDNVIIISNKANTIKSVGTIDEHKKIIKWLSSLSGV